jgi:glyoxylate reductase
METELGAQRVSLEDLLWNADFISIHTPLNEGTRHLFNESAFNKMKSSAYLINTSRGPVINESDLVDALRNRKIAGAGLDVYENEPLMAEGLANLDNAVLVPHIGSATISARDGMSELAARNLLAMLSGERPPNCLNPETITGGS